MPIDNEDLPDILDIIGDGEDPDDDDDAELGLMLKRVKSYIKQHKVTPKTYVKRKHNAVKKLKEHLEAVDLLLLSEAYLKRDTFSGFIRKHEALRRGFLKALLSNLDVDAQIYILQEMLRDVCGDDEPAEHYIT